MQLHHLALGSTNVERLAGFYVEIVGLVELTRHFDAAGELRSIWLGLGQGILMIERTLEPPRAVPGVGSGLFLIAFQIEPGERAALEQELNRRGHVVESSSEWTLYTRDADGNRLAFSHYPKPLLARRSISLSPESA